MVASMRPAQLTPENKAAKLAAFPVIRASMRPAQLTPENVLIAAFMLPFWGWLQ